MCNNVFTIQYQVVYLEDSLALHIASTHIIAKNKNVYTFFKKKYLMLTRFDTQIAN